MFDIGDKVKCIDNRVNDSFSDAPVLYKEYIYEIVGFKSELKTAVILKHIEGFSWNPGRFELVKKAKVMPLERLPSWW